MNRLGPITAFVTTDSLSLHRCIPLGADDIARRCLGRRGRATASHVRPRRARERGAAIPLPRAQDSVARLALIEAAGFLVHQGPPAHPHGLALRCAMPISPAPTRSPPLSTRSRSWHPAHRTARHLEARIAGHGRGLSRERLRRRLSGLAARDRSAEGPHGAGPRPRFRSGSVSRLTESAYARGAGALQIRLIGSGSSRASAAARAPSGETSREAARLASSTNFMPGET